MTNKIYSFLNFELIGLSAEVSKNWNQSSIGVVKFTEQCKLEEFSSFLIEKMDSPEEKKALSKRYSSSEKTILGSIRLSQVKNSLFLYKKIYNTFPRNFKY